MPEQETVRRAKQDLKEGKSASTAAGEFVHEEIEHVREGKHGARSPQQAIAIGLSKARRAGVPLPPPKKGRTKESTRESAERAYEAGQSGQEASPSRRASRAREQVLEKEPRSSASHSALSGQARRSARERGAEDRHRAAKEGRQDKREVWTAPGREEGSTNAGVAPRCISPRSSWAKVLMLRRYPLAGDDPSECSIIWGISKAAAQSPRSVTDNLSTTRWESVRWRD
jgi:hypothetical protein